MTSQNKIRKATWDDLGLIMNLFETCTANLKASGLDQWDDNYPNNEIIKEDIEKGDMWIIAEEQNLASISLNEFQDEQYQDVTWNFTEDPILVIHRLAVHPRCQGKGLGKELCLFAEEFGKKNKYKSIRLDAYSINPISTGLYVKLGYLKTKESVFFDGPSMPVYCYEKKL